MTRQHTIIALSAVVAAVVVVGGVWFWLTLSTATPPPPIVQPRDRSVISPTFKTDVLRKPAYSHLDQQPIQNGSLPVQPPLPVGKPNPFL